MNSNFVPNRYDHLRSFSPADSMRSSSTNRGRSVSTKRKFDDMPSYASIVGGNDAAAYEPILQKEYLDSIQTNIVKVSNMCDKVIHDFSKSGVDPALFIPFNGICEALKLIVTVQEEVLNAITITSASQVHQGQNSRYIATSKRPRSDNPTGGNYNAFFTGSSGSRAPPAQRQPAQDTQVDPVVQKFKEAVKEAEKSTLIFNLNMGKVPIMNKESMSTKATVSLTEMAAATEGKQGTIPSQETIATIDDCLSMVKGMTFFAALLRRIGIPRIPRVDPSVQSPSNILFRIRTPGSWQRPHYERSVR